MPQAYTMKKKIDNLEGKYVTNSILSTVDIKDFQPLCYIICKSQWWHC